MRRLLLSLLLLTSSVFAAPVVSQHWLDAKVHYWSHVLRLEDWDIRAYTAHAYELKDETWGQSRRVIPVRVMIILVLDPADYPEVEKINGTPPKSDKEILADIEDTIVHELVHLRLRDLVMCTDESEEERLAEELTVNRITAALLRPNK